MFRVSGGALHHDELQLLILLAAVAAMLAVASVWRVPVSLLFVMGGNDGVITEEVMQRVQRDIDLEDLRLDL